MQFVWGILRKATILGICCLTLNGYGQQTVRNVDLALSSTQNVSKDTVYSFIKLKPGQPYTQAASDESIHTLYKTGLFEYIKVSTENVGDEIDVTFSLIPKYRLSELTFEGNKEFSKSRLSKEIDTKVMQPLDESRISNDLVKLKKFYEKKGYPNATFSYTLDKDDQVNAGAVTIQVNEGTKVRINAIKFKGNEKISSKELKEVVTTSPRHFFSWITGSGRIKEDQIKHDLEKLVDHYKDKGFLDIEIPRAEITYNYITPRRVEVIFNIKEGEQYYIGDVSIAGNVLYSTKQLLKAIKIKKGDLLSPKKIEQARESIQNVYGHYGYLDTSVIAERVPNTDTGDIDVNFRISEGEKNTVGAITIQGNYRTQNKVILRELALSPGETFNMTRMRNSEAKLKNTGYFEEANLSPEPTDIPNRKNLRVIVKEARTGNLAFGGGFSSLEKGFVFVEMTQSNFDLFSYRTRFRGAGQKLRIRAQIGQKSSDYIISFIEPWAFQRELEFGTNIYHTRVQYVSSLYNQLRTGLDVYLRKNLFELVDGRLAYTIEGVRIFDVNDKAPPAIKAESGFRKVSKLGFSIERDTRDSFVTPTEGNRIVLNSEWAGLGGNTKYVRFEASAGQWWTTFETAEQILQIIGKSGTIRGYDKKAVPLFERYFLGGPDSLRGYDFRKVSPKDGAEPIGGNSFAMASAEYSFRLAKPVRFALFYDAGFVNARSAYFDPSNFRDNWGVGLRIMVMGAPLRLDLGFPLRRDNTLNKSPEFNFAFGTNF